MYSNSCVYVMFTIFITVYGNENGNGNGECNVGTLLIPENSGWIRLITIPFLQTTLNFFNYSS